MIGWVADINEADVHYSTDSRVINSWPAASIETKTAVLTTAYRDIFYSGEFDIPPSPTAEQLEVLKQAQFGWAIHFLVTGEGQARRQAAIDSGVKIARVVGETYRVHINNKFPSWMYTMLDDFKKGSMIASVPRYRDDHDNPAYWRQFPDAIDWWREG